MGFARTGGAHAAPRRSDAATMHAREEPMRTLIPQREHFDAAELLSPEWTLTKAGKSAVCTVWSHQFGFELRLAIDGDDLPRTQTCPSTEDLVRVQEEWRGALEAKGWTAMTWRAHRSSSRRGRE